jgi:hypothetical protein
LFEPAIAKKQDLDLWRLGVGQVGEHKKPGAALLDTLGWRFWCKFY